jgi:tryptophan-rich sensory protein
MKSNWIKLIVAIVVCELAGAIGSIFTVSSVNSWYRTLTKPALNPPAWVFGPVWTSLYALMGIAAFIVWRKGLENKKVRKGLMIFGVQLILNAIWSIIFFGMHNPGLALVDIILLWVFVLWTIVAFYKISRTSVYFLVPYIMWISFAMYLNYAIWALN